MAEDPDWVRDQEGPEKAPLQLKIRTGKYVNHVDGVEREKRAELKKPAVKRPDKETLLEARKRILSNHDMCELTNLAKDDMSKRICQSASAHSSSAFDGQSLMLGSLGDLETALLPRESTENEESDGDALSVTPQTKKAALSSCGGGGAVSPSSGGTVGAVLKDAQLKVNRAHRGFLAQAVKLSERAEEVYGEVEGFLASAEASGAGTAIAREVQTARDRQAFLQALLEKGGDGGGAPSLAQVLDDVKQGKMKTPHEDLSALTSIVQFQKDIALRLDVEKITGVLDFEVAKQQLEATRCTIATVLWACKAAGKDLKAALKCQARMAALAEKKQAATASGKAAAAAAAEAVEEAAAARRRREDEEKGGAKTCATLPVFQWGPACASAVRTTTDASSAAKVAAEEPFLLSATPEIKGLMSSLEEDRQSFAKRFACHPSRTNPGRASMRLPAADMAEATLQTLLPCRLARQVMPMGIVKERDAGGDETWAVELREKPGGSALALPPALQKAMEPQLCAAAHNKDFVCNETYFLASVCCWGATVP